MRELPTGTVTLLFADIEGSANLLQMLGERYADLLAECRQLLSTAIHRWYGHEVDTQDDAFFVAFARASDAIAAAVAGQRSLASHRWPEGVTVRVRMGMHTSEQHLASEGYVGPDVQLAARINFGRPCPLDRVHQIFEAWRTAFPDLHYTIDAQIAEGDQVHSYCTMSGTHLGPFVHFHLWSLPPTCKRFSVRQMHLHRLRDGQTVEHWAVRDDLVMLQQLGVISNGLLPNKTCWRYNGISACKKTLKIL